MRISTSVRLAAVIAAAAVTLAACGGGSNSAAKRAAAVSSTTTTLDPQAAQRSELLAAYDAYNRFYADAVANPDPKNSALSQHLTGQALAHMQLDLAGFQSTHEGIRLSDVSDDPPVVISIDSARAVIEDCTRSIAHFFDTKTGQPEGVPPATAPTSAGLQFVFVREAGVWKLSDKSDRPSACQHA